MSNAPMMSVMRCRGFRGSAKLGDVIEEAIEVVEDFRR